MSRSISHAVRESQTKFSDTIFTTGEFKVIFAYTGIKTKHHTQTLFLGIIWNANRAKKRTAKQKQNVFVSLPNHRKLNETNTFCFCFTAKSLKTE